MKKMVCQAKKIIQKNTELLVHLESANSLFSGCTETFKVEKNQDFILNVHYMIDHESIRICIGGTT